MLFLPVSDGFWLVEGPGWWRVLAGGGHGSLWAAASREVSGSCWREKSGDLKLSFHLCKGRSCVYMPLMELGNSV